MADEARLQELRNERDRILEQLRSYNSKKERLNKAIGTLTDYEDMLTDIRRNNVDILLNNARWKGGWRNFSDKRIEETSNAMKNAVRNGGAIERAADNMRDARPTGIDYLNTALDYINLEIDKAIVEIGL